jgi:hypothetical protein
MRVARTLLVVACFWYFRTFSLTFYSYKWKFPLVYSLSFLNVSFLCGEFTDNSYSWKFHLIMWPETAVHFPKMLSLAARTGCTFCFATCRNSSEKCK